MDEQIQYLTQRYVQGQCTPEEAQELETWYENLGVDKPDHLLNDTPEAEERLQLLLGKIRYTISRQHKKKRGDYRLMLLRGAVAAVLLAAVAVMAYYFISQPTVIPERQLATDAHPGGNRAALTLGDGKIIYLDSIGNGQLVSQGGMQVIKLDSGSLVYKGNSTHSTYNTLTTPRGGQYHLVLPDGSQVWLNAGSSIRFPTAFTGKLREVSMTGEAYFEKAHNENIPFKVSRRDIEVAVLGTHFNINAYDDEPEIKVTLLEGSVRLTQKAENLMLKPGQQGIVTAAALRLQPYVDTEQIMAWKKGIFDFNGATFEQLMRQLSRWYDVEVIYEGSVPQRRFAGQIGRDLMLSEVLKGLSSMGVKFRIEGEKLYVRN